MNEKFSRLVGLLSSPEFLKTKGNNNEVPIFIQPYPADAEELVAGKIPLLAKNLRALGVAVTEVELLSLAFEIIAKEQGRLEKLIAMEAKLPKEKLKGAIARIVDAKDSVIPAIEAKLAVCEYDLIILSGFGAVHPFLKTKPILEGIQRVMSHKPLVVFYPGEYVQSEGIGSSLRLFGTFPALFYRAFNLDTFHTLPPQ